MWSRKKFYYVSYTICMDGSTTFGEGTFNCKGLPDIGRFKEEIQIFNAGNGLQFNSIIITACIEIKKDFMND